VKTALKSVDCCQSCRQNYVGSFFMAHCIGPLFHNLYNAVPKDVEALNFAEFLWFMHIICVYCMQWGRSSGEWEGPDDMWHDVSHQSCWSDAPRHSVVEDAGRYIALFWHVWDWWPDGSQVWIVCCVKEIHPIDFSSVSVYNTVLLLNAALG